MQWVFFRKGASGQLFVCFSFVAGKEIVKYIVSVLSIALGAVIGGFIDTLVMQGKIVTNTQDIYADMRGLRHDLRGHINNITQYVKKQNNTDVEELNNYIRNMEETVSRLDFGYQTGNPITDIIIHQKKQEADRAGVKFSVDFSYPKELQIDVYDIGVILNNALENAIEAAAWLNRNKYVSLHSYVKGNLFFVEVENSFAREIVMNQESGLPESSKLNKKLHGMGLTNIQRCARKYKGDIDIVIGTSKQEQQIFNLTIMLNGKPVGP